MLSPFLLVTNITSGEPVPSAGYHNQRGDGKETLKPTKQVDATHEIKTGLGWGTTTWRGPRSFSGSGMSQGLKEVRE